MTAHSAYHAALAAACGRPLLIRLRQQLFDASEIYRYWSDHQPNPGRDVPGEHKAILDAALGRDVDRAIHLVTAHVEGTARHLIETGPVEVERGNAKPRRAAPAPARKPRTPARSTKGSRGAAG
jgi:DNA-binding GntR family transcriptional regulator